ncbi:MAG: hypothetical protein J6S26_02825 [Solobacterium sp.]|nr:hypothetical protein [Solobacterium sp.]
MKHSWIKHLSFFLVLSFGFLFLSTTAVFAEDAEGQCEPQQEVIDQSDEDDSAAAVSEPSNQDPISFLHVLPEPPAPVRMFSEKEAVCETSEPEPVPESFDAWTPENPAPSPVDPEPPVIQEAVNVPDPAVLYEAECGPKTPALNESFLPEPYGSEPVNGAEAEPIESEDSAAVFQNTNITAVTSAGNCAVDAAVSVHETENITEDAAAFEPGLSAGEERRNASETACIISEGEPSELIALSKELNSDGAPAPAPLSEMISKPAEFVISGTDIPVENGKYSFRLTIRTDRTLTFDNDLENTYQGIDGKYSLHYDINPDESHRMITDGAFAGIITASPLLEQVPERIQEWVETHITNDTYRYNLDLLTGTGFTFENALGFLVDGRLFGYSLKYTYDLPSDTSSLYINGIPIFLPGVKTAFAA